MMRLARYLAVALLAALPLLAVAQWGPLSDGWRPLTGNAFTLAGPILLGNGTAAAPAYSFSAAPTTGIYYDGSSVGSVVGGTTIFKVTNSGVQTLADLMTSGTATYTSALQKKTIHKFDWTNAMVVALGAVTAGDIAVCTLPAKTVVTNAYVVITNPDGSANALTVAVGRVAAGYIDYIVASDAKASANTVYGDASGERGTNLTGYDLPNFTGTTVVNAHFIKAVTNLNTVTGSTGSVYLETMILP